MSPLPSTIFVFLGPRSALSSSSLLFNLFSAQTLPDGPWLFFGQHFRHFALCADHRPKVIFAESFMELSASNLTYTQYIVMMVLWEHGEMTEGELGKKVHLDSGTLAPLLKRLQKAGYINRVRPESNENKLLLSLTEEGESLRERAIDVSR